MPTTGTTDAVQLRTDRGRRRRRHGLAAVLVVLSTGVLVPAVPAGAQSATATTQGKSWKVGDCFAKADLEADSVVLSSKVSCDKPHSVQILHGAPLASFGAPLATASIKTLQRQSGPEYTALQAAAARTCTTANVLAGAYPQKGSALATALGSAQSVSPGTLGQNGWVVPDPRSFNAGNRDLLCVYSTNPGDYGERGDLRRLETTAVLPDTRLCANWGASQRSSCARPHDIETLLFFETPLAGRPQTLGAWGTTDYSTPEERQACAAAARVLMGAERPDVTTGVFPNTFATRDGAPIVLLECQVYTADETLRFPPGTLTGIGSGPITFGKV